MDNNVTLYPRVSMKTEHINHIVLYAKNFYRHTGDIIKDAQRFCEMDGISYHKIRKPENLIKVMERNHKIWVDSLPDETPFSSLKKDRNRKVEWCDDEVVARIYSMLIEYSIYIPMSHIYLKSPIYDRYHQPQFNVRQDIFKKGETDEQHMKRADEFLHRSQADFLDEEMNNLLRRIDFETWSECFHALGDDVTPKVLEDETWNTYNGFVETHLDDDDIVEPDYHVVASKHIFIEIDATNMKSSVDVHTITYQKSFVSGIVDRHAAARELFEMLCDSVTEDDVRKIRIEYEAEGRADCMPEHVLTVESIRNAHRDMLDFGMDCDSFKSGKSETVFGGGGFMYRYTDGDDGLHLDVFRTGSFMCGVKEESLLSKDPFIDGSHY